VLPRRELSTVSRASLDAYYQPEPEAGDAAEDAAR
jgi:hypothetical protein